MIYLTGILGKLGNNMKSNYTLYIITGVLHPEMPDSYNSLMSRYFYNINFIYVHIHS